MKLMPAPENHGIKFQRMDLPGRPVIDAIAEYVNHTERCTALSHKGVDIYTLEHLMATLCCLGIDNLLIQINGPEVPIMDGSAREFATAINAVGLEEQKAERKYIEIKEKFYIKDPQTGSEICVIPDTTFSVDLMIDFSSQILGHQYARYSEDTDFTREIAPCRTFVFFHEILYLYKNNLIKGGSLDNAIVIVEQELEQEEVNTLRILFNKPRVMPHKGYLNNIQLRFDNECARHKLLDLLGDFGLIGMPFKARVIAAKPGHAINTRMAALIRKKLIVDKQ